MYIKGASGSSVLKGAWHVGETLRVPAGTRVLTLQVDGDELTALLSALERDGTNIHWVESQQEMTPIL